MHAHLATDQEFVNMFLDEARLAASIRHPNVVPTLDVQRSEAGLFLVMDYIEGPTLHRLIKARRRTVQPFELPVILRIFIDALGGLHAAHELTGPDGQLMNLIHRDVSPANILVGKDGITRITDFGVARAEARIGFTQGDKIKGKLPYMAPEQLSHGTIDRRLDVYAAGCVLWEMITMSRLFTGDDHAQLLAAVLAGPRGTVREARPEVPESIDQACMRALSHVDERFASAAALAEAIEDAAAASGVRIAAASAVGRVVSELFPKSVDPRFTHSAMITPSTGGVTPPPLAGPISSRRGPPPLPANKVAERRARQQQRSPAPEPAPSTSTSLVTPQPPKPAPSRMGLTIAAVVAAASLGGAGVYFAMGGGTSEAAPGGQLEAPTDTNRAAEDEPGAEDTGADETGAEDTGAEDTGAEEDVGGDDTPADEPSATPSASAAAAPPVRASPRPRSRAVPNKTPQPTPPPAVETPAPQPATPQPADTTFQPDRP